MLTAAALKSAFSGEYGDFDNNWLTPERHPAFVIIPSPNNRPAATLIAAGFIFVKGRS